jgi:hypothetical protein
VASNETKDSPNQSSLSTPQSLVEFPFIFVFVCFSVDASFPAWVVLLDVVAGVAD